MVQTICPGVNPLSELVRKRHGVRRHPDLLQGDRGGPPPAAVGSVKYTGERPCPAQVCTDLTGANSCLTPNAAIRQDALAKSLFLSLLQHLLPHPMPLLPSSLSRKAKKSQAFTSERGRLRGDRIQVSKVKTHMNQASKEPLFTKSQILEQGGR